MVVPFLGFGPDPYEHIGPPLGECLGVGESPGVAPWEAAQLLWRHAKADGVLAQLPDGIDPYGSRRLRVAHDALLSPASGTNGQPLMVMTPPHAKAPRGDNVGYWFGGASVDKVPPSAWWVDATPAVSSETAAAPRMTLATDTSLGTNWLSAAPLRRAGGFLRHLGHELASWIPRVSAQPVGSESPESRLQEDSDVGRSTEQAQRSELASQRFSHSITYSNVDGREWINESSTKCINGECVGMRRHVEPTSDFGANASQTSGRVDERAASAPSPSQAVAATGSGSAAIGSAQEGHVEEKVPGTAGVAEAGPLPERMTASATAPANAEVRVSHL